MTIPKIEEVTKVITQLKARKYEIDQESKVITSKIAFYSGQYEILKEYEENIKTESTSG